MRTLEYIILGILITSLFSCNQSNDNQENHSDSTKVKKTLANAYAEKFVIGAALNAEQILGKDSLGIEIVKTHFNSIVAENCMKSESLQPEEGKFDFALADKFVEFGEKNDMKIIGHTLIWHSQTPNWFFVDENGQDVSREVLIERMKNHITTVVSRYKGKVHGWDVLNEAVNDDGTLRESKFLKIIGEDYIELAFRFAHQADPNAELYYNDYSMAGEAKRNGVVKMVQKLKDKGVTIHGIGMQTHCLMNDPTIENFEKSLLAFAELNLKVMITEMEISVLPWPSGEQFGADVSTNAEFKAELDPFAGGLTPEMTEKWNKRYLAFFKLFIKHSNKIDRVTFWGVHDNQSWKNNWPIKGRTDYPLLFDRNYKAKPIVNKIINSAK